MNKICPDCGGIQPEHEDTTDDGSYKSYCSTCKGKSTIPEDKVKEELKAIYNVKDMQMAIVAGCNSRDEEIKKLRDALDKIESLYIDYQKYGHKDSAPRAVSEMGTVAREALKIGQEEKTDV